MVDAVVDGAVDAVVDAVVDVAVDAVVDGDDAANVDDDPAVAIGCLSDLAVPHGLRYDDTAHAR